MQIIEVRNAAQFAEAKRLIEEYARHNGHADLLRESVDGETGEGSLRWQEYAALTAARGHPQVRRNRRPESKIMRQDSPARD